MASIREVRQSRREQGVRERVIYTFDFADGIVAAPASAAVKVYDVTEGAYTDVTGTVMPTGSATVAGSVVTCPLMRALTVAHRYRVECDATGADGQIETLYCTVEATA